jgi:hypothetical protein
MPVHLILADNFLFEVGLTGEGIFSFQTSTTDLLDAQHAMVRWMVSKNSFVLNKDQEESIFIGGTHSLIAHEFFRIFAKAVMGSWPRQIVEITFVEHSAAGDQPKTFAA